jgi:serine/threonine-protein kinase
MEYIRGQTLEALLQAQGPLTACEATLIGLDLCSAVGAVHETGMLHRDIKTKNVMQEESGRIVLMDFGLSYDLRNTTLLKQTAVEICGTPLYMAPELLRSEKASIRSDIYGIGVVLYHLVTAAFPVAGRNMAKLRWAYEGGKIRALRDLRADLPEAFVRTVEQALLPDPADRFAAAGQMAEALRTSLGGEAASENTVPGL